MQPGSSQVVCMKICKVKVNVRMEAHRVQPGCHWKLRVENTARDVELLKVQFHLVAPMVIIAWSLFPS